MCWLNGRDDRKKTGKKTILSLQRRGRERCDILSSFVDAASADEKPTGPGTTYRRFEYRYMVGGMQIARKRRASEKTVVDKRKTDKKKMTMQMEPPPPAPRHMTEATDFSSSCVSCWEEEERGGAAVAVAARETDPKVSPLIDLHHHKRSYDQKSRQKKTFSSGSRQTQRCPTFRFNSTSAFLAWLTNMEYGMPC